jgi:hypothetical protein
VRDAESGSLSERTVMSHHVAQAGKMMGVGLALCLAVTLAACATDQQGVRVETVR